MTHCSHGRDHKLRVWQLRQEDFSGLSTKFPAEAGGAISNGRQPWLLHSLSVNALNFCAFSMCDESSEPAAVSQDFPPQLIASPNGLDSGGIDVFQLPSEKRISRIRSDQNNPTGMVMAVSLFHQRVPGQTTLCLISSYEDGRVMVHAYNGNLDDAKEENRWHKVMSASAHTQPVLSLELFPFSRTHFLTSSADANITKFALPTPGEQGAVQAEPEKVINSKHAGQQGLSIRSDEKIFATAGWDGRVRVYSCKTLKELAVLKWHKVGCYSTAFADVAGNITAEYGSIHGTERDTTHDPTVVSKPMSALDMIKQQRDEKARLTHWLAAGDKAGKISLWDIY